jgi:hypothetical protein
MGVVWPDTTQHVCTERERESRADSEFIKYWKKLWSDAYILSKDCETETYFSLWTKCQGLCHAEGHLLHNWRHIRSNTEICQKLELANIVIVKLKAI